MLLSAYRYTKGLDLDARAYAEVTGIVLGWIDGNRIFRAGCWVCEFVVEQERGLHDMKTAQFGAINLFEVEVEKNGCLHWDKYMRYREEGPATDFLLARQTLRKSDERMAKAKASGRVLKEIPIWELEYDKATAGDEDLPEAASTEVLASETVVSVEETDTESEELVPVLTEDAWPENS